MPSGLEHPVDVGIEYYAFRVRVMHSKSTGVGSCAGCATPIRLTLKSIQLDQPAATAYNVLLTEPIGGTQIYWQNRFGPLPIIDGFTPAGGNAGDPVTITGARFTGSTAVRFSGTTATFDAISDGEIRATVPDGARTGYVTVETPDGLATSTARFIVAPVITAVTPGRAPIGTTVTITGLNFTETSRVEFNGVSAPFVVGSDTQLYPRVPNGATDGPVAVFNAGGSAVSSDTFHVGPVPIPGDGSINLSWDDCGLAGSELKTFACNTNLGPPFAMMGSFRA